MVISEKRQSLRRRGTGPFNHGQHAFLRENLLQRPPVQTVPHGRDHTEALLRNQPLQCLLPSVGPQSSRQRQPEESQSITESPHQLPAHSQVAYEQLTVQLGDQVLHFEGPIRRGVH